MSEKGQSGKSMFRALKNFEELRRLYDTDTPVLAYAFKRQTEMLAQRKSVTEVAIAVGYDSVSAFIEMFRTMLGTTPQSYFREKRS